MKSKFKEDARLVINYFKRNPKEATIFTAKVVGLAVVLGTLEVMIISKIANNLEANKK